MGRREIFGGHAHLLTGWMLAAIVWGGACSDEGRGTDPLGRQPGEAASPVVVSDPALSVELADGGFAVVLARDGGGAGAAAATGTFTHVVFISLPSATIPGGQTAVIRNIRTSATATASFVSGGFDPVGVEATENDVLEIVVAIASAPTALRFLHRVPARRPPKIVRTSPPRGKRDVALGAHLEIIFSEPMDARTLGSTPVRLREGARDVSGRVEFTDADHVSVVFVPDHPLVPGATYHLVVGQEIHDLDGDPLESAFESDFVTGPAPVVASQLAFVVAPAATLVDRALVPAVRVEARDATGNVVVGFAGEIMLALADNPAGAVLTGTTTVAAVDGVATFTNVRVDKAGTAYRLTASSALLTATSGPFDVVDAGDVVYFSDFEGLPGPEWSHSKVVQTLFEDQTVRTFLGEFGCTDYQYVNPRQSANCLAADSVTLSLANLPEHTGLTITFDLHVLWSWDGNEGLWEGDAEIAPDIFKAEVVGGPTLLNASFAVHSSRLFQSYPAAFPSDGSSPPNNDQNAGAYEFLEGYFATYRLTFTFPHSGSGVAFRFTAPSLQELGDESWGLDNVEVRLTAPTP